MSDTRITRKHKPPVFPHEATEVQITRVLELRKSGMTLTDIMFEVMVNYKTVRAIVITHEKGAEVTTTRIREVPAAQGLIAYLHF